MSTRFPTCSRSSSFGLPTVLIRMHCVAVLMLLAVVVAARAQSSTCPCEASPEVQAALKALDPVMSEPAVSKQNRGKKLEALQSLRRQYPANLFVERQYQNMGAQPFYTYEPSIIEEYRKLPEDHPHDPLYIYLYSRVLEGTKTPEAISGFEKTLQLSPGFAWANLGLVDIYSQKGFLDIEKMTSNLKAFMRVCPRSFEAYRYLRNVKDTDFLKQVALQLRTQLQADAESQHMGLYSTLWQLEFRLAGTNGLDGVRKAIREDTERLKANPRATISVTGLSILKDGYKRVDDKEGGNWVDDQILTRFPASAEAGQISRDRWQAEHLEPDQSAPLEKRNAYYRAAIEQADARLKACPTDMFAWLNRFEAVSELKNVPDSEVEFTVDHLLKAFDESPTRIYFAPSFLFQVARIYVDKNVRLDRVPDVVKDALKEDRERADKEAKSDLIGSEARKAIPAQIEYSQWEAWSVLAKAHLKLRQDDKARQILGAMEESLSKTKPDASASKDDKAAYKHRQATYWEWKGRVAESEGHKTDALVFYQHAILLTPASNVSTESDSDDSVIARATRLWKELGGSDEGLLALTTPVDAAEDEESAGAWQKMAKPLPNFDLPDITGKKWTLADLKGKVAFVNVWATWCGPCRQELPHLQKLYDRLKDRKDVVLFTMNVDDNTNVIAPFLKDHAFTFPVLPAASYVFDFLQMISIPRNWIVAGDGTLSAELVGFGGDGDKWVDEAVKQIETAKGAAGH